MGHDRKGLVEYISHAKSGLNLHSWEVTVRCLDTQEDSGQIEATTYITPGRQQAVIEFQPRFWHESPHEQRRIVIHELFHCHVDRLWQHFDHIEDHLGKPVWMAWKEAARIDMEHVVDALAWAAEKSLPLPRL